MARILIEPVKAKRALPKYSELEKTLKGLYQEVRDVRSGLTYKVGGQEAISARLNEAAEQLNQGAAGIQALYAGLEQIIARYEQTESGNVERVTAEKVSVQWAGDIQPLVEPSKFGIRELLENEALKEEIREEFTEKLLELLGPLGLVISSTANQWKGDWSSAYKDMAQLAGEIGSAVLNSMESEADWFTELFSISADGVLARTEEAPNLLDELFDFSTEGNTLGTVTSWGTAFLGSLISNADEFGANGWTQGRFWEETLVETGIDMVEGAVISTIVGTSAVLLFGNPVSLGVAAATVATTFAVDWALDTAVTWFTGGSQVSWTEWASDGICDGLEWAGGKISEGFNNFVDSVGPVVTKVTDTVKDGIGYAADKISDGFNSAKEGLSNLFSGCSWGRAAVNGGW